MVKDKTAALERTKNTKEVAKGRKQQRGSSSRARLPPGWIQGNWIRSLIRQADLDELAESGLIAKGAARLPEGEMSPQPQPGECVLLATQVFTEMHSMPNGEQALEQAQEGEDSVEDSDEWDSQEDDEEEEREESDEEEEVDSPPRSERRSKQQHDLAGGRGKGVGPSANTQKRTRTLTPEPTEKVAKQPKVAPSKARKTLPCIKMDVPVASGPTSAATDMDVEKAPGDEEATSRAAPQDIVVLPDDKEEEVPLQERRKKSGSSSMKKLEV
ncbi:ribosomal RNA processing protein 1 homolog [Triticum dicoccoides]|uniref:ribosomal RNA processing protein 1 homolog n=1 Tax=Triticum dicoccoides TaxID=85692 RepID=UPI00188FA70A|nr:ribosomal RNA processing protein 1 homolog [Triticum dicoccoides]